MYMKRPMVLCCLPLLMFDVAVAGFGPQASDRGSVTIPLPASWVAFSADVKTRAGGEFEYGRFYRTSDGSTATVYESPEGPVITIHNRQKQRTFARLPNIGWMEQEIYESALRPPKPVLSFAPGAMVRKLDTTIAGGEAYEMTTGPRHVRFAVALNGMVVYMADAQGVVEEYTNIALAEPSPTLLVPEPGAIVLKKHN
jgi:hypothetical protein